MRPVRSAKLWMKFRVESNAMQDLVIFCFETGDASVPYWQELALVDHDKMDYGTLEDSISSYMDSDACDDKEYEEMVEDVLNASEWPWSWFTAGTSVQEVHTYWI